MQKNRGKLMSYTTNTTTNNVKIWTAEEAIQQMQTIRTVEVIQVSSREAVNYLSSNTPSPEKEMVLEALVELRKMFGPKMGFIHGQTPEQLANFMTKVKQLAVDGKLELEEDEDSDIIDWETEHYLISFQIFKAGKNCLSQFTSEPKERFTFRNVLQETYDRACMHESFKAEKMPFQRPGFIAGQKMETGDRVVFRYSSVQLSTDFGGFIIRELMEVRRSFKRTMNMLSEFMTLEERLEISKEEKDTLLQKSGQLLAYASNAMDKIRKYKAEIEPRAIKALGMRNLTRDFQYKADKLEMQQKGFVDMKELAERHSYRVGRQVWDNQMTTTGKKGSWLRKVMTQVEKDELAIMNQDMKTELNSVLAEWVKEHENGMLKIAVVTYVQQYNIEKDSLDGLASFWDTFEEGLLMALHAMKVEKDAPLPVYVASSKPIYFMFLPPMGNTAVVPAAHAELTKRNVHGKRIEIVTVGDEVGIQLECGFFPLEKRADRMKWLPVGRDYTAKVARYKNTVVGGISIELEDIQAIETTPEPEPEVMARATTVVQEESQVVTQDAWDDIDESQMHYYEDYAAEQESAFDAPVVVEPVVLAVTETIVATLKTYTPEQLLTQDFEMKVSPLGTQIFIVIQGAHTLAFSTDVQLSSIDELRHDGTNFIV